MIAAIENRVIFILRFIDEMVCDQLARYALRLMILMVRGQHFEFAAETELGEKPLLEDVRVVGDQDIRRFQNALRRAVVLLQLDHFQRRKILFQQHQILRPRAAPGVDRLVVIPDHGKARPRAHQQLHQLILAGIGVLILIHQQIANALLPAFPHLLIALQQQRRQQDQIVEVEHVARFQMLIVEAVAVGENIVALAARQRGGARRIDQIVLPVGDGRDQLLQQRLVLFQPRLRQIFQQRQLVGIVEQREVGLHAQRGVFALDDLQSQRMKGGDHQAARLFFPQRLGDALFHLARGFIGKGNRCDMARLIAALADQMGNLIGDDAGFARSRSRQHQTGAGNKLDGALLAGV